jgi:hypothetical protein
MAWLLYLVGLIIGAAVFLYIYSTIRSGKEKFDAYRDRKSPPAPSVNPDLIDSSSMKRPPGTRLCPLCGRELTKYEALYASEVEEDGKKKILIHGCRYCYKESP